MCIDSFMGNENFMNNIFFALSAMTFEPRIFMTETDFFGVSLMNECEMWIVHIFRFSLCVFILTRELVHEIITKEFSINYFGFHTSL